jgi:filamentous hemagglutinin
VGNAAAFALEAGAALYGLRGAAPELSEFGNVDAAATGAGTRALGAEVDTIPRNGNRLVLDQSYVSDIGDVACGPTSCAMVMNDRGQWVNISHLAQDAGLVPGVGTDVLGLASALQNNGVGAARAVFGATVDDLAAATANGESAIAHVNLSGDAGHFVVVDGVTTRAGQAVVAVRDPLDGQFFVPVNQFQAKFSGQAVLTNGPH